MNGRKCKFMTFVSTEYQHECAYVPLYLDQLPKRSPLML